MLRTLKDILLGRAIYDVDERTASERDRDEDEKQTAEEETAELRARVAHIVQQRRIRQRG
jgi:hypothetical protein